jgi:AcrR family transcriptional regulator
MAGRSKAHEEQFTQINSWIIEALIWLLDKKSYRTITVEDIVKKAGVARSTFYHHFAGKDDVILRFLDTCFNPNPLEATNTQNDTKGDILYFTLPVKQLLRYTKVLKTILRSDAEYLFFMYCKKWIDFAINLYDEILKGDEKIAFRYMIQYTNTGATQVLCDWIKNDMPISVKKLSEWLTHINYPTHNFTNPIPHIMLRVN